MPLPAIHLSPAAASNNAERNERRRQASRRRTLQRRQLESIARLPGQERRTSTEERRSGLDRRVEWGEPPRRVLLDQHLAQPPRHPRIGTVIDLYV